VYAVARNFDESLRIAHGLIDKGIVETVWLLGGQNLYKASG